jgi:hypothetical protein
MTEPKPEQKEPDAKTPDVPLAPTRSPSAEFRTFTV